MEKNDNDIHGWSTLAIFILIFDKLTVLLIFFFGLTEIQQYYSLAKNENGQGEMANTGVEHPRS